ALVDLGRLDVVLPEVEAARDAGRVRQHDGGDRAAGGVAGRLQRRGDRGGGGAQRVAQGVADAVLRRQEAREDRDVRGERQRNVRVGVLEEHRGLAPRGEVGRLDGRVTAGRA